MIPKYKNKFRTSLAETDGLPIVGIYVLAYMGRVIYVGKAEQNVAVRLQGHWYNRINEQLGAWMDGIRFDWINVRLDVLEPPDDVDQKYWLQAAESALVRILKPLFNEYLQA